MPKTRLPGQVIRSGSVPTTALSGGVVSSSIQVTTLLPNGTVSSSGQVTTLLPTGTVSSSNQVSYTGLSNVPSGIVSASGQVVYTGLSNIPSGIISSSTQLPSGTVSSSTQLPTGIISSSTQLPSGTVSSSGQVQLSNITGTTFAASDFTFPQNVTITGTVTAKEFYTQVVSSSIIYQSGSTKFGDTSDDVMSVTGSIVVSGSVTTPSVTNVGTLALSATSTNIITINTNGTERMRFVSGGYTVGLGVVPSAWQPSWRAIQLARGALNANNTFLVLQHNIYSTPTTDNYIASAVASRYYQNAGSHYWQTTPAGTADTAVSAWTPQLTLLANGNSGFGTVTPGSKLYVEGATVTGISGSGTTILGYTKAGSPQVYTVTGAGSFGLFTLKAITHDYSGAMGGVGEWVYYYSTQLSSATLLRSSTDFTPPTIAIAFPGSTSFTVTLTHTNQVIVSDITVTNAQNITVT